MEHFTVYRDAGWFAGWPHNGGLWQFADGELAVGFVRGRCRYDEPKTLSHVTVDCEQGEHVVLRSKDGGRTWPLESLTSVYTRPALDEALPALTPVADDRVTIVPDPAADGFCLLSGFGIPPDGQRHLAWVMFSQDRGQSWSGPIRLPRGLVSKNPFTFLSSRPNYVLREDGTLLLFAFGSRTGDEVLSRPIVYASRTGGASWGVLAEVELVGPEIMGIMPHPLLRGDGTILLAVRRQYDSTTAYTEIYASETGGRTWRYRSRVNDWGAPATLVDLPDGRIACVYGYRRRGAGVRASISCDAGQTWGREIILRDDGGSFDVGYPRTVLRKDGKLLSVYYFNDRSDPVQSGTGGVRYIAATLWTP